ncbi:MAG TPA: DUF6713 family protein [Thermomicrobiales bacterium]|jgi:hypothetical protein
MMSGGFFFLLGLAFLLTHELDAIRCKEWRIFPVTSALGDDAGYRVFTALHLPLYALLLWGLYGAGDANLALIVALDLFFIVHLGLHLLLRNLPRNEFGSPFSKVLFWGAGLCGALDLWRVFSLA